MIERLAQQQRQNGILSPENAAPSNRTAATSAISQNSSSASNVFSPMVASHLNQIKSSFAVWSHRKLTLPLNDKALLNNVKSRKRLYLSDIENWHPNAIRKQYKKEIRIREHRVGIIVPRNTLSPGIAKNPKFWHAETLGIYSNYPKLRIIGIFVQVLYI